MDMKRVKVITRPPVSSVLPPSCDQRHGRVSVETLPVCQSLHEPERPQMKIHLPSSPVSPVNGQDVKSSQHGDPELSKALHEGSMVASPDYAFCHKPPRVPRAGRGQNKQRIQFAPQQSSNNENSSPGSPLSPSQTHEPARLQSILHRRVSLMETGKDIDAGKKDNGSIMGILEGRLDNLPPITSKTVKVFLSSTFSDMIHERNALMEHVYPKLKDVCREHFGLEFQVVDLRWGVREEAQDDHATVDVCLQEIENCKISSVGPSFVAFIGQKYGYRPFPTKINATEFSVLRDMLIQDRQNVSLLDKWYKIDRNTIPSVWVLQPISSILKHYNDKHDTTRREADRSEWNEAFRQLQKLLRHAADVAYKLGHITERDREKYFVSVTELEIERGMVALKQPSNHCLCFYRHIKDLEKKVNHVRGQKFIDMLPCGKSVDHKAQNLLKVMKARKIENLLFAEKNIRHFHITWEDPEHSDPNANFSYLNNFCEAFFNSMYELIQSSLHHIADLQKNPNIVEILQHLTMCKWRSELFRGREDVLGRVLDYLYHPAAEPLVVYGESGSGKTSVVAKAAYLTHRWFTEKKPYVVLRFLGTTVRSCSIRLVLGNICWQIAKLYGEDCTNIPQDYPKLIRLFHRMLHLATAEHPLLIFLDSLDQLSSSHRAHSLAWVPQELPPNVHLVLSTLPNMFSILDNLHTLIREPGNFIEILPLGMQLSQDLIHEWLRGANRTLTTKQFDIVRDALGKCSLPLYTKLIFDEICRWKSYSPPDVTVLESSVKGVINTLFDRVERYHGKTFVVHALSYLTASRNGLSDNELEDLLSLDDVVLDDVFEHWLPPIRRIPPLLWPRLLNEMSSYIMKREANGIIVFYWYHRQFITVAQERFLSDIAHKIFIHTMIAHYFLGTWGAGQQKAFVYSVNHLELLGRVKRESLADRKVPPQPLIFSQDSSGSGKVVYNMRKLSELPYHLLLSRRSTEMNTNVLFNYEWLHAKLSAMGLQDVLSDFRSSLETSKDQDVSLVYSALRLGGSCINQNPDTLSFDLTSRLLPYYGDHLSIRSLIRQCDTVAQKHSALVPIYQCFEAPKRMLLYVLEDHTHIVFDLIFSRFTKELISISKDGTLSFWDMNFGERTRVVDVSMAHPGPSTKLFQSPDGQYLVIDSDAIHSPLLIFDLKVGQLRHKVGKKSAASRRAYMSGFLFCRQKNIIDVRTGTIIKTLDDFVESKKFVTCGITPNEKYILIGQDKQTSLFDLEMNVCLAQFEGENLPCKFVITADSKKVFIGYTEDCVFKVCDINQQSPTFGQVLITFNYKDALPHTKFLNGPLFHKELSEIAVCEKNQNLVLLNVKRCHLILFNLMTQFAKMVDVKAINANNNTFLFGANFSMDGRYIIAGSHENLHLWSTENCKLVTTIKLHTNDCFPMAVCLENNLIATASNIHTAIKVWDLTNVQVSEPGTLDKYANPVNMVACAPERRLLFIKLYYDYSSVMGYKYHSSFGIDVWNVSTGTHKNFLPLLSYGTLVQMEVSLDGYKMGLLLKTRDDTYLIVFSTKTGKMLCTVMHVDAKLFCMSPLWDYSMTLSDTDIPEVILWNMAAGEKVHVFSNCSSPVFTFDNLYVLLMKEKERVIVYSLKQKAVVSSLMCEADLLNAVPNLHQGVLITKFLKSDYSQVSLWDFLKGEKITSLYGVAPDSIMDISKDGLRAVDGYLQVFDLKSGSLLCRFSPSTHRQFNFVRLTYDSRCVIWIDGLSVKVGDVTNHRLIGSVSLHEKPTSLTLMDYGYVIIIGREDGNVVTLKLMNKGDELLLQDEKITTMEQRSSSIIDIPACSDGVINTFDDLFRKKPVRIKDHDIPKVHEIQHFLEQKARVPHAVINSSSFPDLQKLEIQDMSMSRRESTPCSYLRDGSRSGGSTPSSGTPISGSPIVIRKKKANRRRSKSTHDTDDLSNLSKKKSHSLQDIFNVVRTPPSGKQKDDKKTKRKSPMMLKALQQTGQMFMALADIGSSQTLPRKKASLSDGGQALRAEIDKRHLKQGHGGTTYGRVPSM